MPCRSPPKPSLDKTGWLEHFGCVGTGGQAGVKVPEERPISKITDSVLVPPWVILVSSRQDSMQSDMQGGEQKIM